MRTVWFPIETAPKPHDGLLILWSERGGVEFGFWVPHVGAWFDWTDDRMDFQPTHWTLTPPPPLSADVSRGATVTVSAPDQFLPWEPWG